MISGHFFCLVLTVFANFVVFCYGNLLNNRIISDLDVNMQPTANANSVFFGAVGTFTHWMPFLTQDTRFGELAATPHP